MTEHNSHNHDDHTSDEFAMPNDDLDALLRTWHNDNAARARSRRAEVLRAIRAETTAGSFAGGEVEADGVVRMDDDSAPSPALGGRVRVAADQVGGADRLMRNDNALHIDAVPGRDARATHPSGATHSRRNPFVLTRRYTALAASLMVLVAIGALLVPHPDSRAFGDIGEIMVPDGGKLEAMDELGRVIGPCPLKHTDVDVRVAGRFTRVTVTQQYHNPYDQKIEAVYTFPLSHRSAVDRMTMTIGDRVVIGEVKERLQARQIYEAARQQGHVASLLEQERPNIFTQSVANIEPGARVDIEISYVETLESADGIYTFDFPMVVGPRYIPGSSNSSGVLLPAELIERGGAVLLGPGQFAIANDAEGTDHETNGTLQPGKLTALLHAAHGIEFPGQTWWGLAPEAPVDEPQDGDALREGIGNEPVIKVVLTDDEAVADAPPVIEKPQDDDDQFIILRDEFGNEVARIPIIQIMPQWPQQFPPQPQIPSPFIVPGPQGQPITVIPNKPLPVLNMPARWSSFTVTYCDGTSEEGEIFIDGTGHINGRWFFTDPALAEGVGTGYAPNTDQVPDASRITPMPVRPPLRAGHDINVTVSIDTGGPGIQWIRSDLHDIDGDEAVLRAQAPPREVNLRLANAKEIPNRDFVLSWRLEDDTIEESTFAHFGEYGDWSGGFFTLVLAPPARVEEADARARELIFVLDTSGSMSGYPIEKGKEVMAKAIDAMRPGDTFNLITFAGDTHILWPAPRPNTEQNRELAQQFLTSREGGGGTEMMKAIDAALRPQIVNRPDQPLTLNQLFDLPADEREVTVAIGLDQFKLLGKDRNFFGTLTLREGVTSNWGAATTGNAIMQPIANIENDPNARAIIATGKWRTFEGQRLLQVDTFARSSDFPGEQALPMRIVMFLTDGFVGNDDAIISAVQEHAKTTRVFSFGIGNSVNRHLLDNMARAGRGESEFVLIETDADPAVERFAKRIATPVLTDIVLDFDGVEVLDTIPSADFVPDLFDERPLIIHGRYTKPGEGTLRITGMTAAGRYEREMPINLPAADADEQNDVLGKLWARANIDEMTRIEETPDMRPRIVALGEAFGIMTKHTSFVAVDHSRLTVGGQPVLVPVPIELPDKVSWEGNFGGLDPNAVVDDAVAALANGADFTALDRMQAMLKMAARLPANGFASDEAKNDLITENLRRIRQLQLELRFPEALEIIDEILFIEPLNPAALVLRDSIRTAQLYQEYARTSDIKSSRVPWLSSVQLSMVPPTGGIEDAPETVSGTNFFGVYWNRNEEGQTAYDGYADSLGLVMPNTGTEVYAGLPATTGGEWGETINGIYGWYGSQPQILYLGDVPTIGPAFRNDAGAAHFFEANPSVQLQQQAATEYLYSLHHANSATVAAELSAQLQLPQIQLRVGEVTELGAVDRRVRRLSEQLNESATDGPVQLARERGRGIAAATPANDPNRAVTDLLSTGSGGGGGFGGGGGGGRAQASGAAGGPGAPIGTQTVTIPDILADRTSPPPPVKVDSAAELAQRDKITDADEETVDITVQDTDLNKVLQMMSVNHGRNIITSRKVSGMVAVNLLDLSLEESLDAVLLPQGYRWYEEGNFIYVVAQEEFDEWAKENPERAAAMEADAQATTEDAEVLVIPSELEKAIAAQLNKAMQGQTITPPLKVGGFDPVLLDAPLRKEYDAWLKEQLQGTPFEEVADDSNAIDLDAIQAMINAPLPDDPVDRLAAQLTRMKLLEQKVQLAGGEEYAASHEDPVTRLYGPDLPTQFVEQVLVLTGQLVERGHHDAASYFIGGANDLWPDDPLVTAMRDALVNETLDDVERVKAVQAIAMRARQIIVGRIVEVKRARRIAAVVDPRLAGGAPAAGEPETRTARHGESPAATEPPNSQTGEQVLVSVLLDSLDHEVIDAIQAAGLIVVDRDELRHFVIGRIKRNNIDDLAVVGPVRKIEPVM